MIRSFLTVSTGTLASRLLGFLRDSLVAALLGAGPIADAFLAAFQLVNVARRLLAEGGLNAALVPAWLRVRDTGGALAAAAFAGRVLGTITAALIAATLLLGLLMPFVMMALAPGFSGHETLAARGRQCPADAALPRLCRTGDRADGAAQRARPFRHHGVLAAAVQYRADRGHGRAAGIKAGRRAGRADPLCHGRHRRAVAALDAGAAPWRHDRNAACGFRSMRKSAAFSPRRSPA